MSELVSEEVSVEQPTTAHPTAHPTARPTGQSTGHAGVDEVLASLADLETRPAAEHVAVFENAQERLRAALSEAGDDQTGPAGDVSTGA